MINEIRLREYIANYIDANRYDILDDLLLAEDGSIYDSESEPELFDMLNNLIEEIRNKKEEDINNG